MTKTKKVVVIGGGTGNFVVLSALKKYDLDLNAIVSMADDGGSTGILRDELGVLPPGDVRQCLVALSNSSLLMRHLMNYRFDTGTFAGHSFGNLLLSALEKVTGSFEKAVEEAGKILNIKGGVIPVTTTKTRLRMILKSGKVLEGEKEVHASTEIEKGYTSIYLEPKAKADAHALKTIKEADVIILGPGGLYTSLIPNLLVHGLPEAIKASRAKKVFIMNLMNKNGQTSKFTTTSYLKEIERFLGKDVFDWIIINNSIPKTELIEIYAKEGALVINDMADDKRVISCNLLSDDIKEAPKKDFIKNRNLIRHDPEKLANALMGAIMQPEEKTIIFDLDDTLYDRYGQLDETYKNLPNITPFPDTISTLKSIHSKKILVSWGEKSIQDKKIGILGVRDFFDEIYICSTLEEKKETFQKIIKDHNIKNRKNLIIVGDRIDSEIRFGNMLGATTVLLLHGKYKDLKPKDDFEIPNHTIKKIGELRELIS